MIDKAVAELVKVCPEDPREYLSDFIVQRYCAMDAAPAGTGECGVFLPIPSGNVQHPSTATPLEDTKKDQFRVSFAAFEETRYTGSDLSSTVSSTGQQQQEAESPPDPNIQINSKFVMVEEALNELKAHLLGTPWTDVYSGIEGFLSARPKNNPIDDGDDQPAGDGSSDEGTDEETGDNEEQILENAAEGIRQTLQVLRDCISGYKRGEVHLEIHVLDESHVGAFGDVIAQFKEILAEPSYDPSIVNIELKPFPIRKRYDDYRQMHQEVHVLMWAQMCVSKKQSALNQAQNFEIFVNLIGSSTFKEGASPKKEYDYLEVIPSFGQLVNVLQPSQHKDLCNPDSVVRVKRLVEAVYHFKLSLVRVAEHIIHSVVEGEFLTDVARKFDEAGISSEAHLFKKLAGRRKSCADFRRASRSLLDETIAERARRRQSAPSVSRERSFFDTLR
eukprot:TRINITY_DN8154_c0_g1_i1.p1 TRINITY_DN8154_c0_g1~~TRINITY_DN8154_c0_g1_i1.p1  ORF type:complete len:465 (+),score=85.39 TRINITY_DN8154_c0_g1_i1:59-1396(+)